MFVVNPSAKDVASMPPAISHDTAPTILLIGASRGLGHAMAAEFLRKGWSVVGTVRGGGRTKLHDLADAFAGRVGIEALDICEPDQLAALRDRLSGRVFDMLFVNAGVTNNPEETIADVTADEFIRVMVTNALSPMRVMEREFKTAVALDADFDFAGPERNLGLLYLQAPRIGSIGSKRKAREFLERAVKRAPDYPENHLNLLEAEFQWDEPDRARTQLNALDTIWSKAQTNFTGDAWAQSWDDWIKRRDAAQKKVDENSKNSRK